MKFEKPLNKINLPDRLWVWGYSESQNFIFRSKLNLILHSLRSPSKKILFYPICISFKSFKPAKFIKQIILDSLELF